MSSRQLANQEPGEMAPAETRDQLILERLPQIKFIAKRIATKLPQSVPFDDLVSAGVLGLLDAANKFDPREGVEFKTYAEFRIRGSILDSLRQEDWAPRSLRRKRRNLDEAYATLEQRLGRSATDDEVAAELHLTLEKFHALLDQVNGLNMGYFSTSPAEEGDDQEFLNYHPSDPSESPFEKVRKTELQRILTDAVSGLPEREQLLMSLYYVDELTMKEIGLVLGVNESRVSQLHTRALARLRGRLQTKLERTDSK